SATSFVKSEVTSLASSLINVVSDLSDGVVLTALSFGFLMGSLILHLHLMLIRYLCKLCPVPLRSVCYSHLSAMHPPVPVYCVCRVSVSWLGRCELALA